MQYIPNNFNVLFPKLKKVEILSSNLKKISQLDKLVWLKITGNDINFIDEKAFVNCLKLEYLDLSNNNIYKIPSKLLNSLNALQEINFENNQLTTISWSMFIMKYKLRVVKLANNHLQCINWKTFPTSINVVDLSGNECVDIRYPDTSMEDLKEQIIGECGTEVDLKCDFNMVGKGENFYKFMLRCIHTRVLFVQVPSH